jgi:L-iditol 2-dehydrogenase
MGAQSKSGDRVVYYAPKDVRIERMESPPELEAGDLLVEVEACAICGTDIKSYNKGNPRIKPPMTMGHEFVGAVVAIGGAASSGAALSGSPKIGDRVVMATTIGCGECRYCRSGRSNLCRRAEAIGFHYPGAMAPYVRVPAKAVRLGHLAKVGSLDAKIAAIAEPLSCVVNGFSRLPMAEIKSVLVLGLGPLGFLHAAVARAKGVEKVVCVEFPGARADLARSLALGEVLAPADIDGAYQGLTEGEGFDLVVVTAPHGPTQAKSPMYARKGGYVSFFASLPQGEEMLQVNSRTIHYGELIVYGTSDSTPAHIREAVGLLEANQGLFSKIVTHELPMKDFHKAMDVIASGTAVKVVLRP